VGRELSESFNYATCVLTLALMLRLALDFDIEFILFLIISIRAIYV